MSFSSWESKFGMKEFQHSFKNSANKCISDLTLPLWATVCVVPAHCRHQHPQETHTVWFMGKKRKRFTHTICLCENVYLQDNLSCSRAAQWLNYWRRQGTDGRARYSQSFYFWFTFTGQITVWIIEHNHIIDLELFSIIQNPDLEPKQVK